MAAGLDVAGFDLEAAGFSAAGLVAGGLADAARFDLDAAGFFSGAGMVAGLDKADLVGAASCAVCLGGPILILGRLEATAFEVAKVEVVGSGAATAGVLSMETQTTGVGKVEAEDS